MTSFARWLAPLLGCLTACAGAEATSEARPTPPVRTRAFVEPVLEGPCEGEYLADVGMTGIVFHVEGAGNYTAAVVGDAWSFACAPSGRALVRGEARGEVGSMGVQLEPMPEGDFQMTAYLTRYLEDANARLVASGYTVEPRFGPQALSEDVIAMVSVIGREGRSSTQLFLMRGLRSPVGLIRYTAIAWLEDATGIEPIMDGLFRASHAFMRVE